MFKWKKSNTQKKQEKSQKKLSDILEAANRSADFKSFSPVENGRITVNCYTTLIDDKLLRRVLLPSIQGNASAITDISEIKNFIPLEGIQLTENADEAEKKLNEGHAIVQLNHASKFALVNISSPMKGLRQNNETDNEFSVVGPKIGFIESIDTNLHLLRRQLATTDLIVEEHELGRISKTRVAIVYLNGITNPEFVQTARERIKNADFDVIHDSTIVEQLISDNTSTPFPPFLATERVDKAGHSLMLGQIAILSDGSCYAITAPVSILDFFNSPEDYYSAWMQGSFFRLIRFFGVSFSVFATPVYVAVLTFHYEIIPEDLLGPIIFSRANVPFPPFLEVLFLEITIELLREAGARLPSKIGQTLGIVGGIVIGQATVEAALTSNILLIIVALAALSSFTTPIYQMSNTVRLLRFPFIFIAAIWGGYGLAVGIVLLLGHLFRLKSLGMPYMVPLFPFRAAGMGDAILRLPYSKTNKRPSYLRSLKKKRYSTSEENDEDKDINTE
ncbi:spore germination protein [Neobacillus piezotolerans]|uniref:Spore germination protein n=1 Tax=Neobacillus piezotolerans TaxID=2259171 RepID=A0A3D8GND2_9BACI|nr:spore germination protein [Neobacillus piezotolerans]RDU35973.1 spore germination protein [Neobacillus piezotolerans]